MCMAQIRIHNNKTGVTYIYEGENYYDKEKKRTRTKKRLIGKIDPETGEIVATGKKGRAANSSAKTKAAGYSHTDNEYDALKAKYDKLLADCAEKDKLQAATAQELRAAKKELRDYKKFVRETLNVLLATTSGDQKPDGENSEDAIDSQTE